MTLAKIALKKSNPRQFNGLKMYLGDLTSDAFWIISVR